MAAGSRMEGDASPQLQFPAGVPCSTPRVPSTHGVLRVQCPQGRAAGDTAAEEGPRGAPALLCWPQHASPSSWLALEPQWLPARRPQCTGRKKKQLCFAQSLAINQVPISSQFHVPHPKCARQLPAMAESLRRAQGLLWNFM